MESDEGCPPKPLAEEGALNFVYILQSIAHPDEIYTGLCADVLCQTGSQDIHRANHAA